MPAEERASILAELSPAFAVSRPDEQFAPCVFCSPHSGRIYPSRFLAQSRLDPQTLRKSEDCFVDRLFADVTRHGAPLISALFPRAYLDVNREPFELDPELFTDALPKYANTRSVRVAGGLGTIARIVADGEEIYRLHLTAAQALERIERLYKPFHAALSGLIGETCNRFGYTVLIDCHSMPSASIANGPGRRPDIVIGDRFGASCDGRLTATIKDCLSALGYDVHLNRPYAGGYITENYGRPGRGIHAVQLELNRGLYLDEQNLTPNSGFEQIRGDLDTMVAHVVGELPVLFEHRFAAE